MAQRSTSPRLLRASLLGNALFSGSSGLFMLIAGPTLDDWLGTDAPWAIQVLGVSLMLYALWLVLGVDDTSVDPPNVKTAIVLDVAWVVGCVLLLVTNWVSLTTEGQWTLAIAADLVAAFAIFQFSALRRLPPREVV